MKAHGKSLLASFVALLLSASVADAVIFFGNDNSANQTDPGTGAPWGNVAEIVNDGGSGLTGTAVYIGDGFLLTADHVTLRSHVSFDGTTFLERDLGYTPVQIAPADLKLFRIVSDPGLPVVPLYDGTSEVGLTGTIVGWGIGRDPVVPVDTDVVTWGSTATIAKRWGTNVLAGVNNSLSLLGYVYSALVTVLGNAVGDDEAAIATHDSGSALFVNDGGIWKLAGVGTSTEPPSGTSTFGADTVAAGGQENYFVRISTYRTQIETTVPVELQTFSVE